MENLFLFLATSLVLRNTASGFRRFQICDGCSSLLHSSSRKLHIRYTKEGDKLYFNEHAVDGITYGLICVEMNEWYTLHQTEDILVHYLSRMRKPLHIAHNLSMDISFHKTHVTIADYWQDKAGVDWKIKGYSNGKILTVLYVKNINDTAVANHDAYLNGVRFLQSH